MKNTRIISLIQTSLVLGFLTVATISANAGLDISVHIGTPPPRMPAMRFHSAPEPTYVQYYSDAVLNVGSGYFSLDNALVYSYSRDYNLSPDEVVYILYLSQYSHRSPTVVIDIYQKYHNRGWSVMSRQLGLRSGYPQWMRNKNAPTVAVLYASSAYYDIPYTQVYGIYNRGYQPAEIVVAMNIASRSGQPVNGILIERNKGRQWEDITRDNKMTLSDIKAPNARGKSIKFGAPLTEATPRNQNRSVQAEKNQGKGKGNPHAIGQTGNPHQNGQKGDPHMGSVGQKNTPPMNMFNQQSDAKEQKQDQGKGKNNKNNGHDNGKNQKKNKDKNN